LYQLGAQEKVAEQSDVIYRRSVEKQQYAQSVSDELGVAKKELAAKAAVAKAAFVEAQNAANAVQSKVDENNRLNKTFYSQLASLRNTAADLERQRAEGLAAEFGLSEERSAKIAEVRAHNYATGTKKAYEYIYKEISSRLKGPTDEQEYDFVTTVATGVVHHATLGEDVRLVIISPSAKVAYKELKFGPELYDALTQYDLVPVLNLDGANYKLLVYGYPKTQTAKRVNNDKSLFVQLRSYVQDSAARNVVEIGGLLKDLTDVSKLENTVSTELPEPTVVQKPATTTAVKKPAVKKPVAVAPVVQQEPAELPVQEPEEEIPQKV
jgi:hypothetical protein